MGGVLYSECMDEPEPPTYEPPATHHLLLTVRVEWLPLWFVKLLAVGVVVVLLIVLDWYART